MLAATEPGNFTCRAVLNFCLHYGDTEHAFRLGKPLADTMHLSAINGQAA